ncbi:hypothetical protein WOLCODRAFT_65555, partial [Wolfiporia cocos MD-104 SS10]
IYDAGGGPSEHNLSCYLFKPHDESWANSTLALDAAGSGIGALQLLLQKQPDLFGRQLSADGNFSVTYSSAQIFSWIRCFLITHAHLDHVNSLALTAGSLSGSSKMVHGTRSCLQDIENIFSGRVWPRLASWSAGDALPLTLQELEPNAAYVQVSENVSARIMPVSHGRDHAMEVYDSSVFFIRHDSTQREFLFFGDVEPDSISAQPRNRAVWRAAAGKIPHVLNTIFIECSWPSGRADDSLYGHLNPEHLVQELKALAAEVASFRARPADGSPGTNKAWPECEAKPYKLDSEPGAVDGLLDGLRVYIIHCKDDIQGAYPQPINQVIAEQVRALVENQRLGCDVIAVEQGMKICTSPHPMRSQRRLTLL